MNEQKNIKKLDWLAKEWYVKSIIVMSILIKKYLLLSDKLVEFYSFYLLPLYRDNG